MARATSERIEVFIVGNQHAAASKGSSCLGMIPLCRIMPDERAGGFGLYSVSSEVDNGSREENASKQES